VVLTYRQMQDVRRLIAGACSRNRNMWFSKSLANIAMRIRAASGQVETRTHCLRRYAWASWALMSRSFFPGVLLPVYSLP